MKDGLGTVWASPVTEIGSKMSFKEMATARRVMRKSSETHTSGSASTGTFQVGIRRPRQTVRMLVGGEEIVWLFGTSRAV